MERRWPAASAAHHTPNSLRRAASLPRLVGSATPKKLAACLMLSVLFLASIPLSRPAGASAGGTQWREIGPTFGSIYSIVVDPSNASVVLAGSYFAGLYRSTNYGNNGTWRRVSGITDYEVSSVTADPSASGVFYASTLFGGIFVSHDDGATWNPMSKCSDGAYKYVVDPSHPATRFAACRSGLWVTQNGGSTWTRTPISESTDVEIAPSSGAIYSDGYNFQANSYAIYRSTDLGVDWTTMDISVNGFQPTNQSPQTIAVDPTNASIIIVVGASGTARTVDGGKSWQAAAFSNTSLVDTLGGDAQGFVAFQNSNTVYLGRTYLWKSTDSGATFQLVTKFVDGGTAQTPHTDEGGIAFDQVTGRIYVGSDGGIWVSTDSGASWKTISGSMQNGLVTSVAVDPFQKGTIAVTRQDWAGMISNDNGSSWHSIASAATSEVNSENGGVVFDPQTPGVLYAATAHCGGLSGVAKSTDHGVTWHLLSNDTDGLPNSLTGGIGSNIALDPTNSSHVWLAYYQGVYRSLDGGEHWTRVLAENATNIVVYGNYVYVDVLTVAPAPYYTVTYALWRSEDGGATWTALSLTHARTPISVGIDQKSPPTIFVTANTTMYSSTDAGATFEGISIPSDVFPVTPYGLQRTGTLLVQDIGGTTRIILASASICISCGEPANIYESTDSAKTWGLITGNLKIPSVWQMVPDPCDPHLLFLATWGEGVVVGAPMVSSTTTTTTTTTSSAVTTTTTSTSTTVATSTSTTATSMSSSSQSAGSTSTSASTTTTSAVSTSASSASTSSGGGVPEYPYQFVAVVILVVLVTASYLLLRRVLPGLR